MLLVPAVIVSAQKGCDTILWSAAKKLDPSDFKDVADTGKTMIAFTMTKFSYKVIPQDGGAIINTSTLFYPCNSWLNRANVKNSISHEQLHFDIAEYYKRMFLQRLAETRSAENMFATTTKAIFRDIVDQKRIMNNEYDQQTDKGINYQEQIKWNYKIANLLSNLEKYSVNTTTINLK